MDNWKRQRFFVRIWPHWFWYDVLRAVAEELEVVLNALGHQDALSVAHFSGCGLTFSGSLSVCLVLGRLILFRFDRLSGLAVFGWLLSCGLSRILLGDVSELPDSEASKEALKVLGESVVRRNLVWRVVLWLLESASFVLESFLLCFFSLFPLSLGELGWLFLIVLCSCTFRASLATLGLSLLLDLLLGFGGICLWRLLLFASSLDTLPSASKPVVSADCLLVVPVSCLPLEFE